MTTDNIFVILYNDYLCEYFNGWVIILFLLLICYYVALRNYYLKQEAFYVRNVDSIDKTKKTSKFKKITKDIDEKKDKKKDANEDKDESEDKDKDENDEEDTNEDENDEDIENSNIEGFADEIPITTQSQTTMPNTTRPQTTIPNTTRPQTTMPNTTRPQTTMPNTTRPQTTMPITIPEQLFDEFITTTLFDNLSLNSNQIEKCKLFYNNIIITYVIELTKLVKSIKSNTYLNGKKQFNGIIEKGIDDIINYLNNTIKSMNVLTRTSIRTDVLNILSNTLDNLNNKNNNELTRDITELSKLTSTSMEYNITVKKINNARTKIDEYLEIDKLISKYGSNKNNSVNNVDQVLDKSFILPTYEKNFDKINQLVKSDFNNDYTKLSEKYGAAYTDYLNKKKKEELNINPLELASNIESGIVNFLTSLSSNDNTSNTVNKNSIYDSKKNKDSETTLIEQYNSEYGKFDQKINNAKHNPIPEQNKNLVNTTPLNNSNIYKDPSNLGNYLIDNKTQKQILEGFDVNTSTSTTAPTPSSDVSSDVKSDVSSDVPKQKKKKKDDSNIISKLFSGEFLQYIMDIINEKLNTFYGMYYKKFNNDYSTNETPGFNLDDNLIPGGFLLFMLSMLIYFIDVTS